ncbi:biotin carboxylase OS=Tsukamurella paurometabola (strain ATCC 8368 / DSM / CCUG 35730 / CIP 100753 / JCM 10117 / KCTC 9821 / NBRC 16120 / NCIMB 702349 /NCTC 13040) OX=521096 GN=Tpau_3320 PE=4 SV=1 [Tsukamurella paurometabola]|uniref:biotin carboxylase n=1 Tax=Tsukamurella paurometabola (strain ATCC 8368 / DSM 20162 / CCUG 35730 / CIP 100753 / JCM 10117 / KCTC 9821 / NBRC 16120 / NCIMB 702349 / NCTC 13040) TaxID=521096 RepID=D5UWA6_TSUPD|nr:biotin carboxylase N-terminal domain-containing protein [Tsukamurella paurometabola]ADG79905.1 Carbamoyl-phosphate synthase L chain ATP- binding protein [Tsukamurella paurometabola DSM 20162]SUP37603.1 Acetyl-/propionyl-coenzyme A carboxylase alpha chain [Tsukamurella paurometabola]
MIEKVLIANRGEIACRVIETLREQGIASVAVYSDADADARHVRLADEAVRLGPAAATESYLRIDAVVDAARATGADAVHPGYGFLSENAAFARALDAAGIEFLGPPVAAIETMGDKITARAAVVERDVPVVPGISRPGLTDADLIAAADDIGFPVLIKPSAGGGGKGMHRVQNPADLPAAVAAARREAAAAFGDDTLFMEHFVDTPRHIEVQVLADKHGNVIHLGERECSLQRRHQKVIEEAPSALLDAATRERIGRAACDAARSVGYTGVGTVEFIVSAHRPDEFFFMEMNTRLQVEHPVTELVTGIDLVQQQIRVANGEKLGIAQDEITLTGHAVEARIYAEDPAAGFLPTGGTVTGLRYPRGDRRGPIRVDTGIVDGSVVGSDYDPMLAKVIVHATDREQALRRLDEALSATQLTGLRTNVDFCRFVLDDADVVSGNLDTELLDRLAPTYTRPEPTARAYAAAALRAVADSRSEGPWGTETGWRIGGAAPVIIRFAGAGAAEAVTVSVLGDTVTVHGGGIDWDGTARLDGERLTVDGRTSPVTVAVTGGTYWVSGVDGSFELSLARSASKDRDGAHDGEVTSPMPGAVVAVPVTDGQAVSKGETVVIIEAMKMEQPLTAPHDGTVTLAVRVGEKVNAAQVLAVVAPEQAGEN